MIDRTHPLTPQEFRANDELVKKARAIIDSDVFGFMLEALSTIAPVTVSTPTGISPTDAAVMLGEQTGWEQFKQELLKLGRSPAARQQAPEADYKTSSLEPQNPEPEQ